VCNLMTIITVEVTITSPTCNCYEDVETSGNRTSDSENASMVKDPKIDVLTIDPYSSKYRKQKAYVTNEL
jgi:hypothetical protein